MNNSGEIFVELINNKTRVRITPNPENIVCRATNGTTDFCKILGNRALVVGEHNFQVMKPV